MADYRRHLILSSSSIRDALGRLNSLASDAILFVCTESDVLLGSLTDGDVRRGLLAGKVLDDSVTTIIQPNPKFFCAASTPFEELLRYREENYRIIPVIDANSRKINGVINFRRQISYVPVDVVIMAGGQGMRLRPLTEKVPKPMLKIGDKPIIQHCMEHLGKYGAVNIWLSVNYLSEQIIDYFGNGADFNLNVNYVREESAMGTIGSCSLVSQWKHDVVVICNADVLTNVDIERWYIQFIHDNADISIVSIPYTVRVPYAILEMDQNRVAAIREKPDYTYLANGGFYMIKRGLLDLLPSGHVDAPDFISYLISKGFRVTSFQHQGYWLDIGRIEDFERAQMNYQTMINSK